MRRGTLNLASHTTFLLRLEQVAIPSYRLYQHHPVDPVSGTLVPLFDLVQFLGRAVFVYRREDHLSCSLGQLCAGVLTRLVFTQPVGAADLHDLRGMAGICQLLHVGIRALLDCSWPRQAYRFGLDPTIYCGCLLQCGFAGRPVWDCQCDFTARNKDQPFSSRPSQIMART